MAFKYQALNDSRSSLNSLSSLGSSRSIDSPGAGGRQRPRLEFSAAGSSNRNSVAIMSEVMDRSLYPAPSTSSHKPVRDGEGGAKSDSEWRQSLETEERGTIKQTSLRAGCQRSTYASSTDSTSGNSATSSAVLKQKNFDFSDSSDAPNSQNTPYSSSVESETGLYIHSSVRLGGSGLKFSRQTSATVSAGGDRQAGLPLHYHHHNQSREHGKLFRVLQKFSNKRAQQRVETESEKRARKSPLHNSGSRTEKGGREKESVGHQRRSHKNKQGKKGRFPVSKSSDLLSGFSDVVYRDVNTEVVDPLVGELEVEPDTIIFTNTTTDGLLGGEELSLSHGHYNNSSRAQKYPSMPPSCEVEDDGSASRHKRASVRRTSSLNEGVYHGCSATMDTGVLTKSTVASLSRNGSRKKSHDLLFCQGESRDASDPN